MEPDLFSDLLCALVELPTASLVITWLKYLQRLPRVEMTVILLSQVDKDRIVQALEDIENRHGEVVTDSVRSMRVMIQ